MIADLQATFDRDASEPVQAPTAEDERLAALHRLHVLDQPPQEHLDAIVRLAAQITGKPMAVINLMDADRQFQAAAFGAERRSVTRDQSMCSRTIEEGKTIVVGDSSKDPRYADSPWVTGELGNIRLYAAASSSPTSSASGAGTTTCWSAWEPKAPTRPSLLM